MAALTKKYSMTKTKQGKELSCSYHVCCKLLLKNFIEYLHPLPIDNEELYTRHNCNQFFNTEEMEYHLPHHFSSDMCTKNGSIKIHLFRYFYKLYLEYNKSTVGKVAPMYIDVSCILPELYAIHSDSKTEKETKPNRIVKETMHIVNDIKDRLTLDWCSCTVANIPGLFNAIEKIISLGFYIGCCLLDKTTCSEHGRHAVHIIDTKGDQIVFKDSIGDQDIYYGNLTERFSLDSILCPDTGAPFNYEVEYCVFFLPCRSVLLQTVNTPEQMEAFHTWLDVELFSRKPTFNVGDKVAIGSNHGQIDDIDEDTYMVTYKEGTRTKTKRFTADQLTKVGGTRRRKSRKRIR